MAHQFPPLPFYRTCCKEVALLPTVEASAFLQTTTTLLCGQFSSSQMHGLLYLLGGHFPPWNQ